MSFRASIRSAARSVVDISTFLVENQRTRDRPLKAAVLYLYADKAHYSNSERMLHRVFKWHCGVEFTFVCIDNFAPEKGVVRKREDCFDIGGDNTWWEFSGWKKGIEFLRDNLGYKPDVVVCVNDAFLNLADFGYDADHYRRAFCPFVLRRAQSAFVGTMHKSDTECQCMGKDVSIWIQSNFFAMPFELASICLGPYLTEEQVDEFFDRDWTGQIFRTSAKCNHELQEFLVKWITSGWSRAMTPTEENWNFLRMKLVAILNERMLSVAARSAGIALIDAPLTRWWHPPESLTSGCK